MMSYSRINNNAGISLPTVDELMATAERIGNFGGGNPFFLHPISNTGSLYANQLVAAMKKIGLVEGRDYTRQDLAKTGFMGDDLRVYEPSDTHAPLLFRVFPARPEERSGVSKRIIYDDYWNTGMTASGAWIWARAAGSEPEGILAISDKDDSGLAHYSRGGIPHCADLEMYVRDNLPKIHNLITCGEMGNYLWAPDRRIPLAVVEAFVKAASGYENRV